MTDISVPDEHGSYICTCERTTAPWGAVCTGCAQEPEAVLTCRICGARHADPEDGLCYTCWVRYDKAEADRLWALVR